MNSNNSSGNHVSSLVYTSDIPDDHIVDMATGELIYVGSGADLVYSQPIDIPSITSREVYDEIVKEKTRNKRYRLLVSRVLLDVIIDKQLSIGALSVFCFLGQSIGYNNMVYTSVKEIQKGTSYSRDWVYVALEELQRAGLIREVSHKLRGKADRMFLINPVYFFLGYYPYKENLIKDWMMGS